MTDPLINRLVTDLKPENPLVNLKLWVHCTACLAVIAAAVLGLIGLRADYLSALQNGALFWKPGIFMLAWISCALLVADISRPAGVVKKIHFLPLVMAATLLVWQFIAQTAEMPMDAMKNSLYNDSAFYCLSVITGGGSAAFIAVWKFWLSKTASSRPVLLGILAGISAGALAATAYALHCGEDNALYASVYYGLPIFFLGILGGFLGKNFLRW